LEGLIAGALGSSLQFALEELDLVLPFGYEGLEALVGRLEGRHAFVTLVLV